MRTNQKSGRRGSNPRHPRWQRGALPLSYSRDCFFTLPYLAERRDVTPQPNCGQVWPIALTKKSSNRQVTAQTTAAYRTVNRQYSNEASAELTGLQKIWTGSIDESLWKRRQTRYPHFSRNVLQTTDLATNFQDFYGE
jgi:hypothetical protein